MARILVLSRVAFYRESWRLHLLAHGVCESAYAARSLSDALAAMTPIRPDLTLVDAREPDVRELVEVLSGVDSPPPVMVLVGEEVESTILPLLEAGACGYVPGSAGLERSLDEVRCALQGEFHCSTSIGTALMRRIAASRSSLDSAGPSDEFGLTHRERQIVTLLVRGLANREIAKQLSVANSTVKNHIHNILKKLGVTSRGEAAFLLRRNGTGG